MQLKQIIQNVEGVLRRPLLLCLVMMLADIMYTHADTLERLSYEALIDSAEYYSQRSDWKRAEKLTVEALRRKPASASNWILWSNLAEIRSRMGDVDGALDAYDIGLSQRPEFMTLHKGRAALYISEGRNKDAIEDLEAVLKSDSIAEWPLMMHGMLMLGNNQDEKAEEDFTLLAKSHPSNAQAYSGLANIAARKGDVKSALKYYDKALEIEPDENIYFYKVNLQADNELLPQAAETLREAMKKYPRNGNLFLLRAYLHKLNFQYNEMEIALKLAKEYEADENLIHSLFPQNPNNKKK